MKIKYWDESSKAEIYSISDERNIKVGYFKDCVIESLTCIKRSGADIIFSYFAGEVAEWLNQ